MRSLAHTDPNEAAASPKPPATGWSGPGPEPLAGAMFPTNCWGIVDVVEMEVAVLEVVVTVLEV